MPFRKAGGGHPSSEGHNPMMAPRRIAASVVAAVAIALLIVGTVVLVLTNTDWGREQVRRFALRALDNAAEGEVRIGRLEGNLLRRVRVIDLSITDAQGRPFVRADTLDTRFGLRALLRRRVLLQDTRAAGAVVVLDKPPGEEWNWVRIFPPGDEPVTPRRPGFGDWLELRDLSLVNGSVTIRTEWQPATDLTPQEREETIRRILAGEGRENIVEVPNGYQNVMEFRELNARFPLIVAAHPDSAAIPIEVASFSGIAQPYRPPPALVRDLSGSFRVATDTLYFRNVQAVMPGSRVAGEGTYALDAGDLFLRLNGAPLAFDDMRWLYPPLPEEGGGNIRLDVHRRTVATRLVATEMDLRTGPATIEGAIDITLGDSLLIRGSDLRFARVHTSLLERVVPAFDVPVAGELTGELALVGDPEAMRLDGDVTFVNDAGGARSRVLAEGEVDIVGDVAFRDLRMRFQPLDAALVRTFSPRLPLRGTIEGYANLTGTFSGRLDLESDLTLRDPAAGLSRVRATGGVDFQDEMRLHGMLVRLDPLRLDLLRGEFPELPARAALAGRLRLDGIPTRALAVDGALALDDPATGVSRVTAAGQVAFGDELVFRDMALEFDPLRLDLIRPWAPDAPAGATLAGRARLDGVAARALAVDADLTLTDPATGVSSVAARGAVAFGDELAFSGMEMRFDPLQLNLVRGWVPDLPENATLLGRASLDGVLSRRLALDADLTLLDPASGESRIAAAGGIRTADGIVFDDLALRFSPLRVELVRRWAPDLPPDATVTGPLRLDGSPRGLLRLDGDLAIDDPRSGVSRVALAGGLDLSGDLAFRGMRVTADPLRLDLVRRWEPRLPPGATAFGQTLLDGNPRGDLRVDGEFELHDPRTGVSRLAASGGLRTGEELRFDGLNLRFDPLRMNVVRGYFPDLPAEGILAGRLRLDGSPAAMLNVDADLTAVDPVAGTSRVTASGGIDIGERRFASFNVAMDPLQMSFVRAVAPRIPLAGFMTGTATLDGSPDTRLTIAGDVEHVERGERSRVIGDVVWAGGENGSAMVDVRLMPLSLNVVGRFVPAAELRGTVAGDVRASGGMRDLVVDADLDVVGGGSVALAGSLDLASPEAAYDLRATVSRFDPSAITARAPARTSLTGEASAVGRGTDPATMNAEIVADLVGSRVAGTGADEVRLRLGIADGLLRTDSSVIRLATAEAYIDGAFGLVEGREGLLTYRIAADSLEAFARWIPEPADTAAPARGVAPGTPAPRSAEVTLDGVTEDRTPASGSGERPAVPSANEGGAAGADMRPPLASERLGMTGSTPPAAGPATAEGVNRRPLPTGPTRTLPPEPQLAGSLRAEGGLRGNVRLFDAWGRAAARDFVFRGNSVASGWADYNVAGLGTDAPAIDVQTELRQVRAGGFAFDSLRADVQHSGGRFGVGHAEVAAYAADKADVVAEADFALSLERSEIRFAGLEVRVDTVTWEMLRPALVRWGNEGVVVQDVELLSDAGGRIAMNGQLPVAGDGDLDLEIRDLEIGHIVTLIQGDRSAAGLFSLDARVQGSSRSPVISGTGSLFGGQLDGRELPDVRTALSYSAGILDANAELLRDGEILATADGRVPIDLALSGVSGSRLLEGPVEIDVRADGLPLEMLPSFTDQVEDVQGRLVANLSMRGSWDDPDLRGDADLDLGSLRIVPTGVLYRDVAGSLTLQDELIRVDSLVAWNNGPIRISGSVGLPTMAEAPIDLRLLADNARVIDNDDARMRLDADISVEGTLDAVEVTGRILARSGVVYIPELADFGGGSVVRLDDPVILARADTLLRAERDALYRRNPLMQRLSTDLAVTIDRDVWLRSTEANVEIYTPSEVGPLRIVMSGPEETFSLEGAINTDRGEYEFMSRRFMLTRGAAIFSGEPDINPLLQIAAEHEVRMPGREAFSIRVVLDGYIRELAIALESTSQPPIPQTDLLSYLAFGRDASSLLFQQGSALSGEGALSGGLVGNVAGIATQQLAAVSLDAVVSDIERDAMRSLRLDVFRIAPADLPAEVFTGSYLDFLRGTEIEAGRYVSPRLFLAGQSRVDNPLPGLRLEYRTPAGFSFVTTWMPRFLPTEPTLGDPEVRRSRVFGSFLFREWRF